MGVRGLQTFLKDNERYLAEKKQLRDTSLVIDANNLLCTLCANPYTDPRSDQYRSDVYGGDLVVYAQIVREFFKNLEKCSITSVLVFDGSVIGKHSMKDYVASKEKETERRGLDRFNRAKLMDEHDLSSNDILLPQTINHVFRNVASEFGIQKIQTPYEADTHIARIANELDCPVLTNDSDFYIYALKKGFILLDMLDYKHPELGTKSSYINCTIFIQSRLTRTLPSFDIKNLPLLSVLLGNDYVESGTFDRILGSICGNGRDSGVFQAKSFSHRRIAGLLYWLKGQSLDYNIEYVLSHVHQSNRDKLQRIIKLLLRSYRIEQVDDFDSELEAIYPSSKVVALEDGKKPITPVVFLRRQMENDDLGSIALDMIFRNTHYNYTILDDLNLPSSGVVKFRPYSLALVLLRSKSYENMSVYQRSVQAERDAFLIYDRVQGQYSRFSVKPLQALDVFGPLDHLTIYSLPKMEPKDKKKMLMDCFRFDQKWEDELSDTLAQIFTGKYLIQASLCLLLVNYSGRESKLAPQRQFISALLVTIFYYASANDGLNIETICDEGTYKPMIDLLRPHSVRRNNEVYDNKDRSLFRRIVHYISLLSAAYKGYCLVNSLLDYVFHNAHQEIFFNGTLIYRLTKQIRLKQWSVEKLCPDLPVLADVCDSVHAHLNRNLPKDLVAANI